MANTTITALPTVITPQLTDVYPIDQGSTTYKVSNSQISTLFGFNGSGVLSSAHGGTGLSSVASSAILTTGSTGITQWLSPGDNQVVSFQKGSPGAVKIPGVNQIINGAFQIWQRGQAGTASFSIPASTTQYTADRWQVQTGTGTTVTVSEQTLTSGVKFARVQRNFGANGIAPIYFCTSLTQDMSAALLSSSAMTLSFNALAGANFSSNTGILTVTVYFGTINFSMSNNVSGINGAFPSSVARTTNVTLTTSNQYFFTTIVSIPAGANQMAVQFSYTPTGGTAGTDDWFEVTNVQLEASPNPSPYRIRQFQEELNDCKRFFSKSMQYGTNPVQNNSAFSAPIAIFNTQITFPLSTIWNFGAAMIVVPTVTLLCPNQASSNWSNNAGEFLPSFSFETNDNSTLIVSLANPSVLSSIYYLNAIADADVV